MAVPLSFLTNRKLVVDEKGDPTAVIIPYQEFIDFLEEHGLDISEEDRKGILEAKRDKAEGRTENILSIEELEKELSEED